MKLFIPDWNYILDADEIIYTRLKYILNADEIYLNRTLWYIPAWVRLFYPLLKLRRMANHSLKPVLRRTSFVDEQYAKSIAAYLQVDMFKLTARWCIDPLPFPQEKTTLISKKPVTTSYEFLVSIRKLK